MNLAIFLIMLYRVYRYFINIYFFSIECVLFLTRIMNLKYLLDISLLKDSFQIAQFFFKHTPPFSVVQKTTNKRLINVKYITNNNKLVNLGKKTDKKYLLKTHYGMFCPYVFKR